MPLNKETKETKPKMQAKPPIPPKNKENNFLLFQRIPKPEQYITSSSLSSYADRTNFPDSLSLSLFLSLSICPYHPLLPAGLTNYILLSAQSWYK